MTAAQRLGAIKRTYHSCEERSRYLQQWRRLIEKLGDLGCRFAAIRPSSKVPKYKGWNKAENGLDAEQALGYLDEGYNITLLAGTGDVYAFDLDSDANRGYDCLHLDDGVHIYRPDARHKAKFLFSCPDPLPTRSKNAAYGIELLGHTSTGNHWSCVIAGFHKSGAPILWGGHLIPELSRDTVAALWKEWTNEELFPTKRPKKDDDDAYVDADLARVADALNYIDPWDLDYNAWLGIIAAIHDRFGDDALDIVVHWADGEPGEVEAKWSSFDREYTGQPTTLATVFYFAKKGGWVDTTSKKKTKISDSLFALAKDSGEFFVAQDGEAYCLAPVDDHKECYKVKSKHFRGYLTKLYYNENLTLPGRQALDTAIAALEFEAQTVKRNAFVRVGFHDDKVYIDLGTERWDAIEVDEDGWRIVGTPPIAFRRSKGMVALPTPITGGSIQDLRKYLTPEPQDFPLLVAYLLCCLTGRGPFPVLVVIGEQGSAKSTNLRVSKKLVDPTIEGLRMQPKDRRDLAIAASSNWLLAYDNVTFVSDELSDAFCQLSTGGGFATRSLYTDDEEAIFNIMRPVAFNGITNIVRHSDLMDRAIVINLPRIKEKDRKTEKEFWSEFEFDYPKLLGTLLDTLSVALRKLPNVKLESAPRMADFARLGVAAEQAIGLKSGEFMRLYRANRNEGASTILDASPLTEPLERLIAAAPDNFWQGSPTQLLEELRKYATYAQTKSDEWPKASNVLGTKLTMLAPNFRQRGIDVQSSRETTTRLWTIQRI